MFLSNLNDNEKKMFLEMAYHIINVDGEFSEKEDLLIKTYRSEMSLYEEEYAIQKKDFNSVLSELSNSSKEVKSIIMIELIALAKCDSKYDSSEEMVIKSIKDRWNISDDKYRDMIEWVDGINRLYTKASEIIGG